MDHKLEAPAGSTSIDARMVRTRAALDAAMLELLEEKPFDQITVREIAQTAKVGYATFFRHYPDKEALLNDLAAQQIRDLLDRVLPLLFEHDSRATCLALCAFVEAHRKLWSILLTGGAAATMRQELLLGAKQVALGRPAVTDWLPADLVIAWAVGGVIEILTWWLQQEESYPSEEIARTLDQLVVGPIFVRIHDERR